MDYSYDCSVVIPLKNGEKYIKEALSSCIAQQTQYNFEIVICNDGSDDNSLRVIKKFIDSNSQYSFKLIDSPRPGIVEALNFAIENSKSDLILRFDQDDLMSVERIQTQVKFMKCNPGVVLAGSQINIFGDREINNEKKYKYPEENEEILKKIPFSNCFAHPAVAFRKDVFKGVGGYRVGLDGCEDYDLWLRMVRQGKVINLHQKLTYYRLHYEQHSYKYKSTIILKKIDSLSRALFLIDKTQKSERFEANRISKFSLLTSIILHIIRVAYVFPKDFGFRMVR